MFEFKLPDVGEGIHEAEIDNWLVREGETITVDQPLVEIQTDKAIVELPAPVAGKIVEIKIKQGETAHLGDVIVVIEPTGKLPGKQQPEAEPEPQPEPLRTSVSANGPKIGVAGPNERVLAAPAVRRMAWEQDVDLADVPGSGPVGRILPSDLRAYIEQREAGQLEPTPAPEAKPTPKRVTVSGEETIESEPLQGLRRRIAERMEESWRNIPHVTSWEELDATELVALRKALLPEAEARGIRLTYLPIIAKITVQTLKENPYFNATLDMEAGQIHVRKYYHLGIATAIPDGLVVPVIRHADQMSIFELATEMNRLGELAQSRRLSPQELSGSTFTITNFGSFGGHLGTPIINPPEVAILGTGRIVEKPVIIDGAVEARPVLPVALSYDHRLLDGAAGGAFMKRFRALIEKPQTLLLELT